MAYDEHLAERIRKSISKLTNVEEKRIFGGLAFMVNGKMTLTVNNRPDHQMMVHIDPELQEKALQRKGANVAIMRGKPMTGWIFLTEDAIKGNENLQYWIDLALNFNKQTAK